MPRDKKRVTCWHMHLKPSGFIGKLQFFVYVTEFVDSLRRLQLHLFKVRLAMKI